MVDALSGGRLDLGLAPGYRLKEFEVMGVPKSRARHAHRRDHRVADRRLDDAAGDLPADATSSSTTSPSRPKPVQQPHPPLWIGGSTPAAARRAARFGANFMPDSGAPVEVFQLYRDECAAAGRPRGARWPPTSSFTSATTPSAGWHDVKEHYFYVRQVYQQWFAEAGDLTQVDDSVRVARRSAAGRLRRRHTGDGHRGDRAATRGSLASTG